MTATLNVNLRRCDTPHLCSANGGEHVSVCAARPIPIPCPIPPTFEAVVSLGECTAGCAAPGASRALKERGQTHHAWCPARPIRVVCTISGESWAGSEVTDLEVPGRIAGTNAVADVWVACRDRWNTVIKLLTIIGVHWVGLEELVTQRDAVFAALADMARAEKACHAAFLALPMDLRKASIIAKQCGPVAADPEDGGIDLPSAKIFALYVERIIEQVGVLP